MQWDIVSINMAILDMVSLGKLIGMIEKKCPRAVERVRESFLCCPVHSLLIRTVNTATAYIYYIYYFPANRVY